jgi:hypothetical protein
MVAISIMKLLVIAALLDPVSARLGAAELAVDKVPSYFGEAAVVSVTTASNAEASDAPKLPILLTQDSLQTLGTPLKDESTQPVASHPVEDDLYKVCERTRQALSTQTAGSAMPGGPVYRECMAGLAPLRDHQQDSDAVDTLSDCMALVNALMANKGGDCNAAVAVVHTEQKHVESTPQLAVPQRSLAAEPVAVPKAMVMTGAPKTRTSSKEVVAKQEADALELVSEAMTSVCTETVRDAEVGIKSETDAMKLANSVAPICQKKAEKHLGAAAAATSLTKAWCQQLDGRLTIALETGFFFALSPDEAERQAAEANPYAATTRRKFCGRFVTSIQKQAKDGGFYLNGPPPPGSAASVAKQVPQAAVVAVPPEAPQAAVVAAPPEAPQAAVVAAAEPTALPTLPPAPKIERPASPPPAPKSSPLAAPAKSETVSSVDQQGEPLPLNSTPSGSGVDMLRLVQALSMKNEWSDACNGLISRLTSEEGSVTNEYALGAHETADGGKVLTFNAADQGQVRKCAAQLKVLAIQSGVLRGSPSTGDANKGPALIATGMYLNTADDAEALMDSPWAEDACSDIAHGFLTTRLAHPGFAVPDFCPLYARDLQAMHAAVTSAEGKNHDIQQLRKRSSLKRRLAQANKAQAPEVQTVQAEAAQATQAPVAPKPALKTPSTQAKQLPPAALITETKVTETKDDEEEGMDFWGGVLQ